MFRILATLSALIGGVALLLADSADPDCAESAFDRTFTLSATIGTPDDQLAITETIRVTPGPDPSLLQATFEHVAGDVSVSDATLSGTCAEDNDPVVYTSLGLDFSAEKPTGGELGCSCTFDLETLEAACTPSTPSIPCSATLSSP
jgi:hypothetical protein